MTRFKQCKDFCDLDSYYTNQAKGQYESTNNYIPFQRGSNWFSKFASRYGIPALKYIGKQAFHHGREILRDAIEGKDLKTSAKRNLKRGVASTLTKVAEHISPDNQKGSGVKKHRKANKVKKSKKRKPTKKSTPVRKRKRSIKPRNDIFS